MNPKHLSLLLLAAFLATHETTAQSCRQVPKLVVLLTVDQLRSDYLEAFSPLYGEDGLKKMLKEYLLMQICQLKRSSLCLINLKLMV